MGPLQGEVNTPRHAARVDLLSRSCEKIFNQINRPVIFATPKGIPSGEDTKSRRHTKFTLNQ